MVLFNYNMSIVLNPSSLHISTSREFEFSANANRINYPCISIQKMLRKRQMLLVVLEINAHSCPDCKQFCLPKMLFPCAPGRDYGKIWGLKLIGKCQKSLSCTSISMGKCMPINNVKVVQLFLISRQKMTKQI